MTNEQQQNIIELMDRFLAEISHQTIVEQGRVLDLCLDIRQIANKQPEMAATSP